MPGSTFSASDPLLRQLRRVRRRWNAHELVRAVLLLAAASAFLAALLILAALATAPPRFVAAATILAAAWLASAAGIALAMRGRWLRFETAHHRVDRRARLGGRLAALVDVGATPGGSSLRPLLLAENTAMLPLWAAGRLVPRRVAAGPLAAALAGAVALAAAVVLGPLFAPPPPPTVVVRDAHADRRPLRRGDAEHLPRGGLVAESQGSVEEADDADDSLLGRLADAVQHRVHRELWGEAEAIRAQELARNDARATPSDPPRDTSHQGEAEAPGGGESSGRVESAREPGDSDAATDVAESGGTPQVADAEPTAGALRGAGTADGAARGAGTGTSPDLYGAPSREGVHRTAAPFTLGLTANVHASGGGSRPPTGETPSQMPDSNPALAEQAEEAIAVPRAPVPAEYTAIVRRLFERAP